MNSKGIKLIIQDQLERLRKQIETQEDQAMKLMATLQQNREMEQQLSKLVQE